MGPGSRPRAAGRRPQLRPGRHPAPSAGAEVGGLGERWPSGWVLAKVGAEDVAGGVTEVVAEHPLIVREFNHSEESRTEGQHRVAGPPLNTSPLYPSPFFFASRR